MRERKSRVQLCPGRALSTWGTVWKQTRTAPVTADMERRAWRSQGKVASWRAGTDERALARWASVSATGACAPSPTRAWLGAWHTVGTHKRTHPLADLLTHRLTLLAARGTLQRHKPGHVIHLLRPSVTWEAQVQQVLRVPHPWPHTPRLSPSPTGSLFLKPIPPRCRLRACVHAIPSAWNVLPTAVHLARSLTSLSSSLRNHLPRASGGLSQ